MNAISCADATHCVAVGDGGVVMYTTDGGTSWAKRTTNYGNFLAGVSCPSTVECTAVGALGWTWRSHDGGNTWNGSRLSNLSYNLFAVSCPSTSMCVAVGDHGTAMSTTDGGVLWSLQNSSTLQALFGVSCVDSNICDAVGNGGVTATTTTGGAFGWFGSDVGSAVPLSAVSCRTYCFMTGLDGSVYVKPSTFFGQSTGHGSTGENGALYAISCPSTTNCLSVGDYGIVVATTNAGTGWVQQSAPADSYYAINCPSTTICIAAGFQGHVAGTPDGGTTWSGQTSGTSQTLRSISCPSTTTCFAVGENGAVIATTNGGGLWGTQTSNTALHLSAISCVSTTVCFAVTNADKFIKTSDGGANWSTPAAVGTATGLTGVSCATTLICYATDSNNPSTNLVYKTVDGATWALSFNLANDLQAGINAPFNAISCPTTTTCYAVGASGLIAETTDGGANWRTDSSRSTAELVGVSCPSEGTCYVAARDATILHSADFGGEWDVQFPGWPGQSAYNAVGCPSTTTCFAVGSGGVLRATTTGGLAWSTQRPTGSTADIRGMSCYGSSNCYAAASDTLFATHDGGANWAPTKLTQTDRLVAISCPGANTCFAVGWPGAIYRTTNGGTDWLRQTNSLYGADETLLGVSCASATVCVAVGTYGKVLSTSNGGTTWNSEISGTTGNLFAISCPNPFTCIVVGAGGLALTRSGGSWAAHPSGTTHTLRGVNCVTAYTCYAVGTSGTIRVTTNKGVTWAARTSGTTQNLYGIACLQPSFCVADGNFGTVLVTVDGGTWKPKAAPVFNTLRAAALPDLNHSWLAGFGGTILANPALIPSCTSVSINATPTSPQPQGTVVTLGAVAAGCPDPNPTYRFYLRSPSGVWSIVKNFSTSSSFIWNTASYVPGTYLIGVWAKDAKSGFTYDAYAFGTFTLQRPPCTSTNVSSDVASPRPSGTTVNFSAVVTGCPTPLYQWWVNRAGVWTIVPGHDFAHSSSAFAWNTTGLPNGTYQVGVWAKQRFSTRSYEAFAYVTFTLVVVSGTTHCQAVNVDASPPSPSLKGTSVLLTANPFSCLATQYKWWVRDTAANWAMVQDYPGTNTYTFSTTSRPAGTYLLGVWVRQTGSTASYEAFSFITYTLTIPPQQVCSSVNISPDLASPRAPGSVITFTATALGCDTPNYKFFIAPPGGAFTEVQPYSSTNTLFWNTDGSGPGPWQIGVWARQAGSTKSYEAFAFITFQLTFG